MFLKDIPKMLMSINRTITTLIKVITTIYLKTTPEKNYEVSNEGKLMATNSWFHSSQSSKNVASPPDIV